MLVEKSRQRRFGLIAGIGVVGLCVCAALSFMAGSTTGAAQTPVVKLSFLDGQCIDECGKEPLTHEGLRTWKFR